MISFSSVTADFEIQNPRYFRKWLSSVVLSEKKTIGEIQFIFCKDEYLLDINRAYLDHDSLTDIITFPTNNSKEILSAEIYISIPRVKENAEQNNVEFVNELGRVLVHGILHLSGYKDKSIAEKKVMRTKEDYYLNLQP
jgi:rRNA maturation RNase YbeY